MENKLWLCMTAGMRENEIATAIDFSVGDKDDAKRLSSLQNTLMLSRGYSVLNQEVKDVNQLMEVIGYSITTTRSSNR